MGFSAPFRAPIIAPVYSPGGVIPWYLQGGITLAQCVAAYQPKGAADLATSYVNLAHPGTNNAAPGTAPTFAAATGWTFAAASSQYLTTGITPAGDQTWSIIVRYSGVTSNTAVQALIGHWNTANSAKRITLSPNFTGDFRIYFYINNTVPGGRVLSGNMAIIGRQPYLNGATDGAAVASGSNTFGQPMYIGADSDQAGTARDFLSGSIQAIGIYNVTISSAQVTAVYNAMTAL